MSNFPALPPSNAGGLSLPSSSSYLPVASIALPITRVNDFSEKVVQKGDPLLRKHYLGCNYNHLIQEANAAFNQEEIWFEATKRNPKYTVECGSGFVYLIHATETPYYKIGLTGDLKTRLAGLSTASFTKLKLVASAFVNEVYMVEMQLHSKYELFWKKGEWFMFPDKMLKGLEQTFMHLHQTKGELNNRFRKL